MEFEQLVRDHRRLIFGIAIRIVRNSWTAEEICQETFFKVWQALPEFKYGCPVSAWIALIARNTSISRLRIEAKHRCSSLTELPDVAVRNRDQGMELAVRQLVQRLPEKHRQIVDLFYFQGWPIKDIATLLGVRDVTVRGRLHSARRALEGRAVNVVGPRAVKCNDEGGVLTR